MSAAEGADVGWSIFYNPTCLLCGEPVLDPFWDKYCYTCEHGEDEDDEYWDEDPEEDW